MKLSLPVQVKYLLGNECAERFSYYGMRSILVVFMMQRLMFPESKAKAVFHFFVSASYFLPLLGAYVSDKYWGKYKTILYSSGIYCLGHLFLSVFGDHEFGLYGALALVALGTGGVKATVSAHLGDQFTDSNKDDLERIYGLFYWFINAGSTVSFLLIPFLLIQYGPQVAFAIPGLLMGIALWLFWLGRKKYIILPPSRGEALLSLVTIKQCFRDEGSQSHLKALWKIGKVFFWVSMFWALYEQQGSTWVLQADRMEKQIGGMKVEASQLQALNPFLLLLLIPVFTFGIYPALKKRKMDLSPTLKMTFGMFATAMTFVSMGIFELLLDHQVHVHVLWHLLPYLLITVAEILISIPGLEFAYLEAPKTLKSTVMSLWFLTIAFGNFFTGFISWLNPFKGAQEFFFYASLMFLVVFVFRWVAKPFAKKYSTL